MIGKKILITAGPTHEKIDPVRYISNYSSGKMGFTLAEEFVNKGAEVILISGPVALNTNSAKICRINVKSAEEMYSVTLDQFPKVNIAILCAAVADYRPIKYFTKKIKRSVSEPFNLILTPNPDIAASLGKIKKSEQILIGFALETEKELTHSIEKLWGKNLDFIILNSLKDKGAGFQSDTNKITIINKNGGIKKYPLKQKKEVAKDIINYLFAFMNKT